MKEDQLRELFLEMRDEPVPADSQVRVRMAVAERTHSWRERMRRYWMVAAVLVPALAVMTLAVWRPAQPVAVPLAAAKPTAVKPVEPDVAVETPAVLPPRVVRVRHRIVKLPARQSEAAVLIRIETPDPDVVILLVGG